MNTNNKKEKEFIEVPNANIGMIIIIVGIIFGVYTFISDRMETQRIIRNMEYTNESLAELQANNADDFINLPKYR
jgi:hypothetical protein